MANFHTNVFTLAGNKDDMTKALMRLAENLEAAKGIIDSLNAETKDASTPRQIFAGPDIDFSVASIDDTSTPEGIWKELESALDAYYNWAFSPKPEARGMSESASVYLWQVAECYVLGMRFSTAWAAAYEDIDGYLESLSTGTYGYTLVDADEGDWYATVTLQHAMAKNGKYSCLEEFCANCDRKKSEQLWELLKSYVGVEAASVKDLSELALMFAVRQWNDWGEFGEDEDGNYREDMDLDDEDSTYIELGWRENIGAMLHAGPYGWGFDKSGELAIKDFIHPSPGALAAIKDLLLKMIYGFPYCLTLNCHFAEGDSPLNLVAEKVSRALYVGDEVHVVSEWDGADAERPNNKLHVYAPDGEEITSSVSWHNMPLSAIFWLETEFLALILPHLRFTIWEKTPAYLRRVDWPDIILRVDLEPADPAQLVNEAVELLSLDPKDRSRTSITEGSDL